MQNPIPSPRRSDDVRPMPRPIPPLPRRTPLVGPVCLDCEHPSCRVRRAQRLPRLGGHRSEFSREHAQAAVIQARHRHLIVYYGEATQSFWAVTPSGLLEAASVDALLLALWPHAAPLMPPALAAEAATPVPA
ncbi:hypothetical protein [Nocardiopsis deserti]|uniref:hypothetical protein n=1 Tax=Nocardiopsis deserti TaxID=2605988 RepID=UPI00123BC288|nr:hypothetical protein [Nocardiopsis deserti]